MIHLTENAIARILKLGKPLRLSIVGGGCSGFQYIFEFGEAKEQDVTFEQEGALIMIDPMSLEMMDESVVDFKEDLTGSRFIVQNPKASVSCGCGNSFG